MSKVVVEMAPSAEITLTLDEWRVVESWLGNTYNDTPDVVDDVRFAINNALEEGGIRI